MPTKSKQPAQPLPGTQSLDEVARRYFSQKERKGMDSEDFGDPDKKAFPVKTQQDLDNAARLVGHADNPDAVKTRLKGIAKKKGLKLPDSWQAEEASKAVGRAAQPDDGNDDGDEPGEHNDGPDADALIDDLTDSNKPDEGEEHKELMDDLTSVPGRVEPAATIERAMPAPDVTYYAPITRIDREKREVIGTATAEVKDSYRTVIGYEASKDAFARWRGNIREMHQSKAVGRALEITPDDEHRRIIVRARISKGAQDTWEKVLDGTLTGFSIGGKNGKWTTRVIDGEELPYLERYDQAELSLVDNPGCPVANFEVVRADGLASDILAPENEMPQEIPEVARTPDATVERAGARLSQETRDAMHQVRDHAMNAAKSTMQTCGCDDCVGMLKNVTTSDDPGASDDPGLDPASMRAAIADIVREQIAESLREQMAPMLSRVNALLAHDAQRNSENPEITRRVDDITEQLAAIKDLCETIAAQPADGGPILHGAAVDKRLATQSGASRITDPDVLRRAMELGMQPPTDINAQVAAAAALVRPIPR